MDQKFWLGIFDLDRGENQGTDPYGVKKVVKMTWKCMKNRGFGIFGSEGPKKALKVLWMKIKNGHSSAEHQPIFANRSTYEKIARVLSFMGLFVKIGLKLASESQFWCFLGLIFSIGSVGGHGSKIVVGNFWPGSRRKPWDKPLRGQKSGQNGLKVHEKPRIRHFWFWGS